MAMAFIGYLRPFLIQRSNAALIRPAAGQLVHRPLKTQVAANHPGGICPAYNLVPAGRLFNGQGNFNAADGSRVIDNRFTILIKIVKRQGGYIVD
jgi:hypothetical protein